MATARAPGKLVFLGEYAVVDGAPAVVAAVNRYAIATSRSCDAAAWQITATNLGDGPVSFRPGVDTAPEGPMQLACALLEVMVRDGALVADDARDISLDTSALFEADGKLGLGSSAAVLAALHRLLDPGASPGVAFRRIDKAHRQVQKGLGSGVDVAAAVTGGLMVYVRGAPPALEPLRLPVDVHWAAVYTGVCASTARFLSAVTRWREHNPADYAAHRRLLTDLAERGAAALRSGDGEGFCSIAGAYGKALGRFGRAAGVAIESMEHTALADVAARNGVNYKVSGAGGGDVGLAFSTDVEKLEAFCARVPAVDPRFRLLDLDLAATARK